MRGPGTWQSIVDCNAELAIPVPTNISDELAARAYINPLAALMMLRFFPVKGKRVLLTAAGSDCALYLGQWAIRFGAKSVAGIHRSPIHHKKISSCGILPISQDDLSAIQHYSSMSDVVYDATGGDLAELILNHLPKVSKFIGYGSLSGEPYKQALYHPSVTWFHLRNYLDRIPVQQWQSLFLEIWPLIRCSLSNATYTYPISSWKDALKLYKTPGRIIKPMLKIS